MNLYSCLISFPPFPTSGFLTSHPWAVPSEVTAAIAGNKLLIHIYQLCRSVHTWLPWRLEGSNLEMAPCELWVQGLGQDRDHCRLVFLSWASSHEPGKVKVCSHPKTPAFNPAKQVAAPAGSTGSLAYTQCTCSEKAINIFLTVISSLNK